eukprot:gnl/MRDRNA2_/MRDRNA2_57897_c0_seq1.p1 gnl/MRDRNA2_/MRDRNA2_57897_c0~~gnl/MRDRNA2_/MRDRNA2_57897_c0_seq1.p1  ORF type:complete len:390 (-),score=49.19 gnl/MRDRNA2_/MRDRNA2_57897_c0_seq1:123-1292(-)
MGPRGEVRDSHGMRRSRSEEPTSRQRTPRPQSASRHHHGSRHHRSHHGSHHHRHRTEIVMDQHEDAAPDRGAGARRFSLEGELAKPAKKLVSAVRAARSSLHASRIGMPSYQPGEDVKTGARYSPPDDTYAGISGARMDCKDRGLRTNIPNRCGGDSLDIANASIGQGTVVKTARRVDFSMYQRQRNPILHDYETDPEKRQRGGPNASTFDPMEEEYSVFKRKHWQNLTGEEKKHMIRGRKEALYRICGAQDLCPAGTADTATYDRPASAAVVRYNDRRLLAPFEVGRVARARNDEKNQYSESPIFRDTLYWIGAQAEHERMKEENKQGWIKERKPQDPRSAGYPAHGAPSPFSQHSSSRASTAYSSRSSCASSRSGYSSYLGNSTARF